MELSKYCKYTTSRIDPASLNVDNYISTENMMQNKGGVTAASKVPTEKAVEYKPGDILISNIRPYFKKIWLADRSGGCSSDVLCIRALKGTDSIYLYYLLSQDSFFDYVMSGAKGSKMPRGDKSQIMKWDVDLPGIDEQRRIGQMLKNIDDKIAINNRINHNLEEQIQERFDSMIISDNGLGYCQIADYVDVNPKRSLRKNEPARCVDMSYLSTTGPFPSGWETKGYNGGMKFFNGDTIMARITPCLENGKVAYVNFLDDGEIAFGSTEFIVLHAKEGVAPVFTYFLARNKNFVDYATKNMNGSSGRQRVSGDTIGKYMIPVIDSDSLNEFSGFATPAMDVIRNNSFESRSLAATRDALLPLLLLGELSISQMNC